MVRMRARCAALIFPIMLGCSVGKHPVGLLEAVGSGDSRLMEAALRSGADVNKADRNGYTPLAVAAFNGDVDAVRFLIRNGAKLEHVVTEQRPLYLAVSAGHEGTVGALLEETPDLSADSQGPAILAAARTGGAAKALIEHKVDVAGVFGFNSSTALHVAAQNARPDIVRVLIENGAPVNAENVRTQTPLHLACYAQTRDGLLAEETLILETLGLLIDAKARVEARDARKNTPLHLAARNILSTPAVIQFLLDRGASPKAKNILGRDPLLMAHMNGRSLNDPVMKLLAKASGQRLSSLPKREPSAQGVSVRTGGM